MLPTPPARSRLPDLPTYVPRTPPLSSLGHPFEAHTIFTWTPSFPTYNERLVLYSHISSIEFLLLAPHAGIEKHGRRLHTPSTPSDSGDQKRTATYPYVVPAAHCWKWPGSAEMDAALVAHGLPRLLGQASAGTYATQVPWPSADLVATMASPRNG